MVNELVTIVMHQGTPRECHYSLPQKKYDEQVTIAKELLGPEFDGYLSLEECIEAQGLLDKTNYFRNTNTECTKRRIEKIKAAGIPPIFDPGIESPIENSTYPVLDVLIQLPSGKLFEQFSRQQAFSRKIGMRRSPRIYASTMEDILAFRTLAYDGDKLSPHVVRDILDYFSQKDYGSHEASTILKVDYIRMKYLEASLRGVKPQERTYIRFDLSQSLNFIGKRFWHVRYTPEDRMSIVREYQRRIESRGYKLDWEHSRRMKVLFPEILDIDDSELEMVRNKNRMKEHIQKGNFISMPQIVLVDHRYGTEYINALHDHVTRECDRVIAEEPTKIFQPIAEMHQEFKIPSGFLFLEPFRAIVTVKRIEVLQKMDEHSFIEYFHMHPRRVSIGHRKFSKDLIDRQFRSLLLDRYAQLKEVQT